MLLFAVFAVVQGITHISLMQIAGYVGIAYCTWAIAQFFDKRKPINYVKALSSYIMGMITFLFVAIITGTLIDLVLRH